MKLDKTILAKRQNGACQFISRVFAAGWNFGKWARKTAIFQNSKSLAYNELQNGKNLPPLTGGNRGICRNSLSHPRWAGGGALFWVFRGARP